MALTPDTGFLTRFPEFTAIAEARIQLFLDEALLEIREGDWGAFYTKALNLMTAHLLTLADMQAAATGGASGSLGPVASRSVGDVSVSFGVSATSMATGSDAWLNATPYGQELARLIEVVGCDMVAV